MITDDLVSNAKATGKRYEISERGGLILEVLPNGAKVWRYRYMKAGKRTKVMLGRFPTVSIVEARRRRDDFKARIRVGSIPTQFETVTEEYAAFYASQLLTYFSEKQSGAAPAITEILVECLDRSSWDTEF